MPLPLCALAPGESAQILSISADEALHHRLSALGFQYGKTITVLRAGILKGPLQVAIGTTQIIIRRKDAAKITVQKPA
jgi:ferrous iron transport protein A